MGGDTILRLHSGREKWENEVLEALRTKEHVFRQKGLSCEGGAPLRSSSARVQKSGLFKESQFVTTCPSIDVSLLEHEFFAWLSFWAGECGLAEAGAAPPPADTRNSKYHFSTTDFQCQETDLIRDSRQPLHSQLSLFTRVPIKWQVVHHKRVTKLASRVCQIWLLTLIALCADKPHNFQKLGTHQARDIGDKRHTHSPAFDVSLVQRQDQSGLRSRRHTDVGWSCGHCGRDRHGVVRLEVLPAATVHGVHVHGGRRGRRGRMVRKCCRSTRSWEIGVASDWRFGACSCSDSASLEQLRIGLLS